MKAWAKSRIPPQIKTSYTLDKLGGILLLSMSTQGEDITYVKTVVIFLMTEESPVFT